jgi:peroxiredoxin Q/BCP
MVGVGEKAADFELPAHTGEIVRLSSLRGRRVVLFFYPKDGSPGCTRENCMVNDMFSEFERLDAVVIGISRDGVESHRRFAARHGLKQLLLSDVDGSVSRAYGALGFLGASKRKTFVIDRDGTIVKVVDGVLPGRHVKEALETLKQLG